MKLSLKQWRHCLLPSCTLVYQLYIADRAFSISVRKSTFCFTEAKNSQASSKSRLRQNKMEKLAQGQTAWTKTFKGVGLKQTCWLEKTKTQTCSCDFPDEQWSFSHFILPLLSSAKGNLYVDNFVCCSVCCLDPFVWNSNVRWAGRWSHLPSFVSCSQLKSLINLATTTEPCMGYWDVMDTLKQTCFSGNRGFFLTWY